LTTTTGSSYTGGVFALVEILLRDLRYGLRGLRRAPAFSAIVILTLALGLGANTAIFSVVRAVLLKPLPYPDSERLVRLGEFDRRGYRDQRDLDELPALARRESLL